MAPDAALPRGDAAANRDIYGAIAAAYDGSRRTPWPPVVSFLTELSPSLVLDVAAGNLRHAVAAARAGHRVVAADLVRPLLALGLRRARADGLPVAGVVADMHRLPFATASFPVVLAVAAVHTLRGRSARHAALAELARVATPGARILVTVWERDEKRFRKPLAAAHEGRPAAGEAEPEAGDIALAWRHGVAAPVMRFFHLYTLDELAADLAHAGLEEVTLTRERLGAQGTWNLVATARR